VREYGSLGCSGDLAPLAHIALVVAGEGELLDGPSGTSVRPAPEALRAQEVTPIQLSTKEGLTLVNGTEGMLGMLVLACQDLGQTVKVADISAAMSTEALRGSQRPFAADIHALRPHPGQATSATNLVRILAGSQLATNHVEDQPHVQDAYSIRCAPQVAGAVRDTLSHAGQVAARELAARIDNPVVLPDGRLESNGNFHGAPIAMVCDFLAIAAADLASIAERRTDRILDSARSGGLPPFLAARPGVDSGYMIAQYTQAAIVAEMKRQAVPASVDSIPTSAMQEDHVSMGWSAARKLRLSLSNLSRVLAIELATAARAVELRAPLQPSAGTSAALAAIRRQVPPVGPDRFLSPELRAVEDMVVRGEIVASVEAAVGTLH
jgi:histidine ammonia-lyase